MREHRPGSSPRLRGTHLPYLKKDELKRFIPAPAGNTVSWEDPPAPEAVHPRACGEHSTAKEKKDGTDGSSPRLRGTRYGDGPGIRGPRFIPAPAGNTPCSMRYLNRRTVHPRACGEHLSMLVDKRWQSGSSPRLRGTHPQAADAYARHRFIPAPAGNTCYCSSYSVK